VVKHGVGCAVRSGGPGRSAGCRRRNRLPALVPPPRIHRHRYFGVLAPNSPLRTAVTTLALAATTSPPAPISIDPENDTPGVMKEYLKRYRAGPGWDFLTGSRKDIDAVMRAFNAYIPNKMSHYALTFIHAPTDDNWIKLLGIMSSSEFADEAKKAGLR
jgi:SCO1/SenC family protein